MSSVVLCIEKVVASICLALLWVSGASADPNALNEERAALAASITVVSDYRDRGISLSDGDPALQVAISSRLSQDIGLTLQANTVSFDPKNSVELGASLGLQIADGEAAPVFYIEFYHYPGASGSDYLDLRFEIPVLTGSTSMLVAASYAPPIHDSNSFSSTYGSIEISHAIASSPWSIDFTAGIEDRRDYDTKLDWSLSISAELGSSSSVSIGFYDTKGAAPDEIGDPRLVGTLQFGF